MKTKKKIYRFVWQPGVRLAVGTVALSLAGVAAVVYSVEESAGALVALVAGAAVGLPAMFKAVADS